MVWRYMIDVKVCLNQLLYKMFVLEVLCFNLH